MLRYRLRTLLIVLTLATPPLAWLGYRRDAALRERQARDSFHALVRDTAFSMKAKADGRAWEQAEAAFSEAGYAPISTQDAQYTSIHRHLIRKGAWTAPTGTPHDLLVEASVDRREPSQSPSALPGIATAVTAGLVGHPNVPLSEALENNLYPANSCVVICLSHEQIVAAVDRYPILKKKEVTYDLIRHHRTAEWPFGYHVDVELGSSVDDDQQGMRFFFTVVSHMDPRQDWDGNSLTAGFVPSPELGPAWCWGHNEWHASK